MSVSCGWKTRQPLPHPHWGPLGFALTALPSEDMQPWQQWDGRDHSSPILQYVWIERELPIIDQNIPLLGANFVLSRNIYETERGDFWCFGWRPQWHQFFKPLPFGCWHRSDTASLYVDRETGNGGGRGGERYPTTKWWQALPSSKDHF